MDTPDYPTEQVAEALHLSGGTVELEGVAGYDLVETWERERSGTRFYRFMVDPTGDQVLVKAGIDWKATEPRALAHAQTKLAQAVAAAAIPSAGAVEALGWVEAPPLFVMPYVDGTDLVSLLREPSRSEWASMAGWIRAAGSMLAIFHKTDPIKRTVDPQPMFDEIRAIGRRMRLPSDETEAVLRRIDPQKSAVRVYGDFGPGNLIGVAGGDVYLIDPPVEPTTGLFHRDLGNFLFEMRRQLAGHGYTRTEPVRGKFPRLRDALLDGYVEQAGLLRLSPADRAVIAMYEMRRSAGMVRKRLPRRPADAVWFTGSAVARRRDVRRLASQLE